MNNTIQTKTNTVDGRIERTNATYRRILDVTRELLLAGVDEPTAREIAEKANITTRTLFRHFSDMESLYKRLVQDADESAISVMNEPFDVTSDDSNWQALIELVIARRVRVHESLLPLYVSSVWVKYRASRSGTWGDEVVKRRRMRPLEILPNHIVEDRTLFEAIDATLSIEFWISLRRDQGLSVTRAKAVLQRAVHQLTAYPDARE